MWCNVMQLDLFDHIGLDETSKAKGGPASANRNGGVSEGVGELSPGTRILRQSAKFRNHTVAVLVAFRDRTATALASATVFVPDAAATHFLKKIEQYATENAKPPEPKADAAVVGTDSQPGKSKHEQLIAHSSGGTGTR